MAVSRRHMQIILISAYPQEKINDMKKTLDLESVPQINKSCEKCMYLDAGKDLIT